MKAHQCVWGERVAGAFILQYIFFFFFCTVPELKEGCELELKSIGRVVAPVQLRLSLLTRCTVRSCCHTSVLPSHHSRAACTHLLLCHFHRMGPFAALHCLANKCIHWKAITTHKSQLPNEMPVLTLAHDRWRSCQQAENSFHQPAASRKS